MNRKIFNNSCDRIFAIQRLELIPIQAKKEKEKEVETSNATDDIARSMMAQVLVSLDSGTWHHSSAIGIKFHQIDKSFDLKITTFRGIEPLIKDIAITGGIEIRRDENKHLQVRLKSISMLNPLLNA